MVNYDQIVVDTKRFVRITTPRSRINFSASSRVASPPIPRDHSPYEILAVRAERRLLEEAQYELVILDVVDVALLEGALATPQHELAGGQEDLVGGDGDVVLGHRDAARASWPDGMLLRNAPE